MSEIKLNELSKSELYELARKHQIKGRTEMDMEELKKAIMNAGQIEIESELFDLGEQNLNIGSSTNRPTSDLGNEVKKNAKEEVQVKKSVYFDGDPLPEWYGDNKIVLMPKNAQWAYAYWEIAEEKRNEINNQLNGEGKLSLRVYDVTLKEFNGENANSYFDIELPEDVSEWFIGNLNSTASYVADIGYKTNDGKFIIAARSTTVTTASNSVSSNIDTDWMIVEEYFKKILARSSAGRLENGKWIGGIGASGAMRGSSEEMVSVLLKRLLKDKRIKKGKLLSQLEKELGLINKIGGSSSIGAGSLSVGSLSAGSLSVGGGETLKNKGNVEMAEDKIAKKDFWLKVGTELILYGATEPDAKVTVMGEKIELNSDGTFSFRYALPNGHYELPVIAVSKDGDDTRQITPIVDRTEK
ncbi:MAG: hypothetical protein B6I28_01845 [Fusobacteriia bacterium 4572_132]|nr:MAG: hypothetical protein B6I28_01845 [Fusobacteriia bacterium 4572_132]